jgi:ankyrin
MLIEHGADVTAQNKDRATPLHLARKGQVEVARMLIEHGADVTARTGLGTTSITSGVADGTSGNRSHAY